MTLPVDVLMELAKIADREHRDTTDAVYGDLRHTLERFARTFRESRRTVDSDTLREVREAVIASAKRLESSGDSVTAEFLRGLIAEAE